MVAYRCDICGAFYDHDDKDGKDKAAFNPFTQEKSVSICRKMAFLNTHYDRIDYADICPDCVQRMGKFIADIRKETGYNGGNENA